MKHIGLIVAVICGIVLSMPAHAADKRGCTNAVIAAARKNVIPVPAKDWAWGKLFDSYTQYGVCAQPRKGGLYDVDLGSAYNDAIKHLLIDEWNNLGDLTGYVQKDAAFGKFVLSYISDSYEMQNLNKLADNAHAHCPANANSTCAAIEQKIKDVKKEIADLNAQ